MRIPVASLLAVTTFALLAPRRAGAQDLDAERFKPAVTHDGFIELEGSAVRDPSDRWELGLFLNYSRNSLIVVDADGDLTSQFVSGRLGFDLYGSVTIAGPFAVGLDVPFFLAQTGDASPSFAGLGDIRIAPKLRILDDRDTLGLALIAELRAPTHAGDFAGGARNVVVWPKLALDHRFAVGLRFGVNAGVAIREKTTFLNVDAGTEITYAGALGYRFGGLDGVVELGAELNGAAGVTAADAEELPLEGLAYLKIDPSDEWEIALGPGVGLVPGYGIPVFRAFAGIRWTPTSHDKDHDGVPDGDDKCPDVPEDRDGDRDRDGCPEEDADDDHDGVSNANDDCPNQKETINGFQDEDGCPDPGDRRVIYEDGKVRVLDNVRFRSGSAEIDPESYTLLDQVALTLKANDDIERIRVEGHTDDTGPRDVNVRLSKARANSVRDYLIRRGVSPKRLTAEGYGPDKPLVNGTDEAARGKNRRVEFIIDQ
jgi:outer membrane protein OmpA-like peptidoglycan-associated protein